MPPSPPGPHRAALAPQEVFPDAEVKAEVCSSSRVKITAAKQKIEVANVAQRDLYRKYRWPAAKDITAKLEMFKETMEE